MGNCKTCGRNGICNRLDQYRNMACMDHEKTENKKQKKKTVDFSKKNAAVIGRDCSNHRRNAGKSAKRSFPSTEKQ